MKTSAKNYWLITFCCVLLAVRLSAQSYTEIKGNLTIYPGSGATEMSQMLYIGPVAVIAVNGDWRIASQLIYISPLAQITGSGSIIFDDPTTYTIGSTPLAWNKQTVDGGGVNIGCDVQIRNGAGVALNNLTAPQIFGYASDTVAQLNIAKTLTFAGATALGSPLTGNNLTLNNYDVWIAGTGAINNFTPDHFIVTNAAGNCDKDALGATGFIFPVGIDSADYTPAQLLNTGVADQFNVRVLQGIQPTYSQPQYGINRTWNIAEANSGADVTLVLQHNFIDGYGGPGTQGGNYNDGVAYVSASNAVTANWDGYPLSAGIMPGILTAGTQVSNGSMLTRTGLTDFTTHTRFTKFSLLPQGLRSVKTAVPDSVVLGDNFNYHFVLTNTSSHTILGPITLTDTLPLGAIYVAASGTGFVFTDNDKIVTAIYADSIAPGDSIVMDITVQAFKVPLDNVAFVRTDTAGVSPTAPCDTCTPGNPTTPFVILPNLNIPDAFSPNGDGINDLFVIAKLDVLYPQASLDIYNRYGDEAWSSQGAYKNNFDGKNYSGTVLPDGTYFYVFKYNDGSKRSASGFINISRQ